MNEKIRKIKKRFSRKDGAVLLVVLALVMCAAFGYAKYSTSKKVLDGQADAERFYFTTNLLGDSTMLNASGDLGEGNTYSFPDVQSGTWYLYGKDEHTLSIQVQNFSDDLRITKDAIRYNAKINMDNGYSADNVKFTNYEKGEQDSYTLEGTSQSTDEWTLNIPAYQTNKYKDGTCITITLTSTAPYEKSIELNFILSTEETALKYRIEDSENSPYANLILMNYAVIEGSQNEITPSLTWPKELSIDNTNILTYKYENEEFTQQENIEGRTGMLLNQGLNPGESVSIYFFKEDPSKNYSALTQVVSPNDGNYVIDLTSSD